MGSMESISVLVPTIIGRNGWEKIVDLHLNDNESAAFEKSASAVRTMNDALSGIL